MTPLAIHYFPCSASDARRLGQSLAIPAHEIELHRFPDGEMRVRVGVIASTTILYASLDQPNDKLLAILFAAEALRRGGARRLVLVAPYLCYMRQDAAFHEGEAISQKVIGQFLSGSLDRVVTVDAHLHRTTSIGNVFPGIEADNISAIPAIAEALRKTALDPRTVVVGPDVESRPWVRDLADRIGVAHAVARKDRHDDRTVTIAFDDVALLSGRPVILFDDIVSSGGTLMACAKALATAGAYPIDVIVTHALFDPKLAGELEQSGIRSIRSTHSVPHPTNAFTLDDVLAESLSRECSGSGHSEISR